ncbi:CRTC2 protein, partial [Hylia prasina]|nr:CRTC2 protein [Hylia prasina]
QLQAQKLRLAHSRGPFYSGSLPNVNQIGTGVPEFQVTPRAARRCLGEWGHGSPRAVLPPPWLLVLHPTASLIPLSSSTGPCPGAISRWKKDIYSGCPQLSTGTGLFDSVFSVSPSHSPALPWDPCGGGGCWGGAGAGQGDTGGHWARGRQPRSCPDPVCSPSIFPSPDQPANVPLMPSALNTGGSLPDLTTLHFPSPLPTPLDPEEAPYPPLSGGSSTSNLATTMTHLGISGTG